MAYINYTQYVSVYGASPVSEAEFPAYAQFASDLIDSITYYRIVEAGGLATLPAPLQSQVVKAVAAQIMYFSELGLEAVMSGTSGANFTVGKVSVGPSTNGRSGAAAMLCPMARVYLEQTGLMRPSVDVRDGPRYSPWGGW